MAYNNGVASIEVDLWLYEDGKGINTSSCAPEEIPADQTLLIGHDLNDLDPRRTFKKVYLDPIMSILNETTSRPKPQGQHGWNGIFTDKGAPGETLLLTIDLVSSASSLYPANLSRSPLIRHLVYRRKRIPTRYGRRSLKNSNRYLMPAC